MSAAARFAVWLQAWGAAGLFGAAVLDAFVPLAQVVDPMVVLLSYQSGNPFLYAGLAVAGSTLGNTVLFLLVRAGGEAFAGKRIRPERRAAIEGFVAQNGLAAVIAGAILPPPFPLKGVVLIAGLVRMRLGLFVLGMVIARTFRYGIESTLAVFYGEQVLDFMKHRYPIVGLAGVGLLLATWLLGRRLLRARAPQPAAAE